MEARILCICESLFGITVLLTLSLIEGVEAGEEVMGAKLSALTLVLLAKL